MIQWTLHRRSLQLTDTRDGSPVFHGADVSLSYTTWQEDITAQERISETTPYVSQSADLLFVGDRRFENRSMGASMEVSPLLDGVRLSLKVENDSLSQVGLHLPFNFVGKKNGGGYEHQYLFTSPYRSQGERYRYICLERPDGNHLFLLFLDAADGWKMDYSPYVGGHYFVNLQVLASFDKAYRGSNRKTLELAIFPVLNLKEGLQKASKVLNVPILTYSKSFSTNGKGEVEVIWECDSVVMETEDGETSTLLVKDGRVHYSGAEGKCSLTPYWNGVPGFDASIYCYEDPKCMGERVFARLARNPNIPGKGNCCEWQNYIAAMKAMKEDVKKAIRIFSGK